MLRLLNHQGLLWTLSIHKMCLKHGDITTLNTKFDESQGNMGYF